MGLVSTSVKHYATAPVIVQRCKEMGIRLVMNSDSNVNAVTMLAKKINFLTEEEDEKVPPPLFNQYFFSFIHFGIIQ